MKKMFFIIIVISFFYSCKENKYSVLITNNSSKSVFYTYNNISDFLGVSETKFYEVEAYTQPPKNITDQNGIASIAINKHNLKDEYTFIDAIPLELNVKNNLSFAITIKADNFIDNKGFMKLTIDPNCESTGAKIYTKSPQFMSTSNYPINIEWIIVENIMSVIIR